MTLVTIVLRASAGLILLPVIGCSAGSQEGQMGRADVIKIVGRDIQAGVWRTRGPSANCYWARLSDVSGNSGTALANGMGNGPMIVEIGSGDMAFRSTRCGEWTRDLSPITSTPEAAFRDGMYIVGTDIAPGLWRSDSPTSCYWARLRGFSGGGGDTIANDLYSGVVEIMPSDVGFLSNRCGTWTKDRRD